MIARMLLTLFACTGPVALAQIGLYGETGEALRAGDIAPDLKFDKVLNSPGGAEWKPANLYGKLTILIFYLNTSKNIQTITMWNASVDQYADKPVRFLLISGEEDETLTPFLRQNPIKGWVFHDVQGNTGKAYGLEQPTTVFIAPDRTILGFGHGFPPQPREIDAALAGRVTTTRPTRETLRAFEESGNVLLGAEPERMMRFADHKPKLAPSYTLHVTPGTSEDRGNSSGDDFWSLRGTTLKEAILLLYGINPVRAAFPASMDDRKSYNFELVLPQHEDRAKMQALMQQGIQDYFHLKIAPEDRVVDVYLASIAPDHKPPAGKPRDLDEGGGFSSSSVGLGVAGDPGDPAEGWRTQPLSAVRELSVHGTSDELCSVLESSIDRPVINETGIQGVFELEVKSTEGRKNDFLGQLREGYGIVLTPAQRTVAILGVQAR